MRHTHYWVNQHIPHELVFLNNKWLYGCSVCDKCKFFTSQPLNPIAPTEWQLYEMSDKARTLSPPMFASNDEFAAGDRYRRYLNLPTVL